jgi:hypothetical protein
MRFHKGWSRLAVLLYVVWCVAVSAVWYSEEWPHVATALKRQVYSIEESKRWRQREADELEARARKYAAPYLRRAELEELVGDLRRAWLPEEGGAGDPDRTTAMSRAKARLDGISGEARAKVLHGVGPDGNAVTAMYDDAGRQLQLRRMTKAMLDSRSAATDAKIEFLVGWAAFVIGPLVLVPLAYLLIVVPVRWVADGFRTSRG